MSKQKDERKIWLVKHPIAKHYEETQTEVKELARRNHLRVRDAAYPVAEEFLADKPPKLTEKGKKKAAKAPKATKEPKADKVETPDNTSGE